MLLVVFAGMGCATVHAEGQMLNVLAVGNSFSANALRYFSDIVKASGHCVVASNAMISGCDFERHMRHADAFETNLDDPNGRPYPGKKSLKDLLTACRWDYVTIQQASPKSFRPETYHPHSDRLIAYIKKYAPQAEIVIHETWAYRDDHRWFTEREKNKEQPADHDTMYRLVRATYDGFAKDTGFRMIPSGDAMELARLDPAWGKKDLKTGMTTLSHDAFHANTQGEYLIGCVWFEFFFKQSAIGNAFVPEGMTSKEASVLQRVAHQSVTEKQRP